MNNDIDTRIRGWGEHEGRLGEADAAKLVERIDRRVRSEERSAHALSWWAMKAHPSRVVLAAAAALLLVGMPMAFVVGRRTAPDGGGTPSQEETETRIGHYASLSAALSMKTPTGPIPSRVQAGMAALPRKSIIAFCLAGDSIR